MKGADRNAKLEFTRVRCWVIRRRQVVLWSEGWSKEDGCRHDGRWGTSRGVNAGERARGCRGICCRQGQARGVLKMTSLRGRLSEFRDDCCSDIAMAAEAERTWWRMVAHQPDRFHLNISMRRTRGQLPINPAG